MNISFLLIGIVLCAVWLVLWVALDIRRKEKPMKVAAILLTIGLALWAVVGLGVAVYADFEYTRDVQSYWELADKASTLKQKAEYVTQFAQAVDSAGLAGTHNALFLKTPDNSFDANRRALASLQGRLEEIMGMDTKSFEYQQAILQITQQEQGEAQRMLKVLEGCWFKEHYRLWWDWIGLLHVLAWFVGLMICCICWGLRSDVL